LGIHRHTGVEKALDSLAAEIFTPQAMASAYGIPKCVARKDLAIAR
jgi:hypothetical protein